MKFLPSFLWQIGILLWILNSGGIITIPKTSPRLNILFCDGFIEGDSVSIYFNGIKLAHKHPVVSHPTSGLANGSITINGKMVLYMNIKYRKKILYTNRIKSPYIFKIQINEYAFEYKIKREDGQYLMIDKIPLENRLKLVQRNEKPNFE
jgi:hypothetical protein